MNEKIVNNVNVTQIKKKKIFTNVKFSGICRYHGQNRCFTLLWHPQRSWGDILLLFVSFFLIMAPSTELG